MPLIQFWRNSSILASLLLAGTGSLIASAPVSGSIAHQDGSPAISFIGAMVNSSTSVTFQAGLSPNGLDTTYVFDYGLTTAYGQTTPTQDAGSGISSVMVTVQVTGLLPNTTYHYQVVATNSAGSMASPDSTVITTSSSTQTTTTNPRPRLAAASITIVRVPVATPARGQSGLTDVSCASTFCLAVGLEASGSGRSKPLVERWTGTSFVKFSSPPTLGASLYAIDCTSSAYCLAVGRDALNAYSARFTGRGWQALPTPSPVTSNGNILTGLSCISPTNCWSVGYALFNSALVEHWNGSAWSVVHVPSPHASLFNAVSCSSSTNCWAVGSIDSYAGHGSALVEHWNGRSWSISSVPSGMGPLTTITCKRVSMCWIDGSFGQGDAVLRFIDGLWKMYALPKFFGGFEVSCTAVRNCLNVGTDTSGGSQPGYSGGFHPGAQWNGRSWIAVDAPGLPPSDIFRSTVCISAKRCLLVGINVGSSGNNYVAIGGVTRPA